MTDSSATARKEPADGVDFDRVYSGEETADGVVFDRLPWDIGGPQPELIEIEQAGRIVGEVLDVGCGPGDTAIYLGKLGYRVTGVDIAAKAIEEARARAAAEKVSVTFEVADATVLYGYDGRFATVVSSQLLHCLAPERRRAHVTALARALRPGGRLIQFCVDLGESISFNGLYSIPEEELRATFGSPDWSITTLRPGRMWGHKPPAQVLSRFAEYGFHPEFTDDGLMLMPVSVLEAQRL